MKFNVLIAILIAACGNGGTDGTNGANGSNGAHGSNGSDGTIGAQGPQGVPGPPGPSGAAAVLLATDESEPALTPHAGAARLATARVVRQRALYVHEYDGAHR